MESSPFNWNPIPIPIPIPNLPTNSNQSQFNNHQSSSSSSSSSSTLSSFTSFISALSPLAQSTLNLNLPSRKGKEREALIDNQVSASISSSLGLSSTNQDHGTGINSLGLDVLKTDSNGMNQHFKSLQNWWGSEEVNEFLWKYRTVVTAGTASLVSTAASFPFDSLKSRLQVKEYKGIWDCAKAVVREEGMRGFFRGVTIPLITISFVRTSSFSIYFGTKDKLHSNGYLSNPNSLRDIALSGAAGGATSGVLISCGSAPFELVKVQRQLEYLIAMQKGLLNKEGAGRYKSMTGAEAARNIMRNHGGFRGFYLGFRLHIMRDTLGTAFYFGFYDTIRSLVGRYSKTDSKGGPSLYGIPNPIVSFLSGSTAGIASWLIVYPVDLLKTNVQQRSLSGHPRQLSELELFHHLLREKPPKPNPNSTTPLSKDTNVKRFLRLYRGLGVSALRSFISHGLTWLLIESISESLSKKVDRKVSYVPETTED